IPSRALKKPSSVGNSVTRSLPPMLRPPARRGRSPLVSNAAASGLRPSRAKPARLQCCGLRPTPVAGEARSSLERWEATPSARRQGSELLQDFRPHAGVAGLGIAPFAGLAPASDGLLQD